jgi:hypothetical protein
MFVRHRKMFRHTALATALAFGLVQVPLGPASAELIGTERVVPEAQAQGARSTIDRFMARDDVRAELVRQGVDPAEAAARAGALSDQEAVDLAQKIETAPSGGLIGSVVGAAAMIFVLLVITDLLGFTSVFGFTNKGSARL